MSDESTLPEMDENLEVLDSDQALDIVQNTMDTFLEAASVDAVYGEPIENGDTLIIPTAEIISGLGFGVGTGYGGNRDGEETNEGGGGGGGGGGRVLSRPVAVIISSPEGVRVEPVVDVTKVALAALTAFGFMWAMVMRMRSPRRMLRELKSD
ncbi:MAG TPA: spore germination protein GerW family protein [Anaerolineales bacterium]